MKGQNQLTLWVFNRQDWLVWQGILVLCLLVINLTVVMWDARLRHNEMYRKALDVTAVLKSEL